MATLPVSVQHRVIVSLWGGVWQSGSADRGYRATGWLRTIPHTRGPQEVVPCTSWEQISGRTALASHSDSSVPNSPNGGAPAARYAKQSKPKRLNSGVADTKTRENRKKKNTPARQPQRRTKR